MQKVLDEWGRVDVLVNNALHVEPGHNDRFVDVPMRTIEKELDANVLAFVALTKLVLPGMLERGDGTIINLSSTAGYMDPPVPSGEGGWSVTYALTKGAFHRLAGMLALELGDRGIKAFNVQPGFVLTERMEAMSEALGIPWDGAPPPRSARWSCGWLPSPRRRPSTARPSRASCSRSSATSTPTGGNPRTTSGRSAAT